MAHIVEDNVRESTTTTGTGSLSLGGALNTGRTFSSVCADADTVHYAIHHTTLNEWEIGLGTYETTGNLLLRTAPLESSNAGAAVNFSAGTKNVELTIPGQVARVIYGLQTLTGVASTTEALTGTAADKAMTPDAIAALWEKGADNSGGATITLGDGYQFDLITSTTTITALAFTTDKAGRMALLRFATARQVTHNATSLISPSGGNLSMGVGDFMLVESLGSGNFRIITLWRNDVVQNLPGVVANTTSSSQVTNATTNIDCVTFTIPANTPRVGSVYRLTAYCAFVHTAAATPTLTAAAVVNGVEVITGILTPPSTALTYPVKIEWVFTIRSIGASGTMNSFLLMSMTGATGATTGGNPQDNATTTIDTTVNRTITLRLRMTTAVVSNSIRCNQGLIEKVN